MSNKTLSPSKIVITESISLFLNIVVPSSVWIATALFGYYAFIQEHYWALLLLPMVASLCYIAAVFLIRLALPKLQPGTYDLRKDTMAVYWYLHMSLNRCGRSSGLLPVIRSSNILRYLYFRALGAKISYTSNLSIELELMDPSLVTIGPNVIVGGRCYIGCHTIADGVLTLGNVEIQEDAFISMGCVIGPGSTVAKEAIIGGGNTLYRVRIPDGYKLPSFLWREGPHRAQAVARYDHKRNLNNPDYADFHKAERIGYPKKGDFR